MKKFLASAAIVAAITVGGVAAAAPAQAATNVKVCTVGSSHTYATYKFTNGTTVYKLWPGQCITGNIFYVSAPSGYIMSVNGGQIPRIVTLITNTPNLQHNVYIYPR